MRNGIVNNASDLMRMFIIEKNVTQTEFANTTGIPRTYVSKLVSGKSNWTLNTIGKVKKAYPELDTSIFFGDDVVRKQTNQENSVEN